MGLILKPNVTELVVSAEIQPEAVDELVAPITTGKLQFGWSKLLTNVILQERGLPLPTVTLNEESLPDIKGPVPHDETVGVVDAAKKTFL